MTQDPPDLNEIVEKVVDENTFLEFVEALRRDRSLERKMEDESPSSPYGPGALGWENSSIEQFLESAGAWAADTGPGNATSLSDVWRRCAQILHAGKFYE